VAWLLADIKDTFEVLVAAVIEQVLIGNAASPLRKALMDSQLGTALSDGTGYDAENRDTMFSVGLKDVSESDAKKIETIVFDVLHSLADGGIEPELVESAIHQIEFQRKEVTNTPYPYGIKLLIGISASWLHGGDPERMLQLDADFNRLRKVIGQRPVPGDKIRHYFLENPHRVRFTLVPDQQMAELENQRVTDELAGILAGMDEATLAGIRADAAALEKLQETQENLTCLPTLQREDIPPSVVCIDPTPGAFQPPVWTYDQPTSGIFIFQAAWVPVILTANCCRWCHFSAMRHQKWAPPTVTTPKWPAAWTCIPAASVFPPTPAPVLTTPATVCLSSRFPANA
jgi:Zn-dependent M16 (insulinase) family peptidase